MIPGEVGARPATIVYVIDEDRDLLSAFTYENLGQHMIHMNGAIALDRLCEMGRAP